MSTRLINNMNRMTRLFQPMRVTQKGEILKSDKISKSHQLMIDMGIMRRANAGLYTLLPLGLRALDKLIDIVDEEMTKIGAQKLLLPSLTRSRLWEKTNRLQGAGDEIFKLVDRHENAFILSPTYEEAITDLVANIGVLSPNKLPLRLYQISNKWRDELKPRLGLLRAREFSMKDLYSFDSSLENARKSYDSVREAYANIFQRIGLEYTIAVGDPGTIGGNMSHEYHYTSEIGEDTVLSCRSCNFHINANIRRSNTCDRCNGALIERRAIEVGHTFLLDTKYSKPLEATFVDDNRAEPLVMGCYGLGLTRLLAATVEILSEDDRLGWPKCLAPYTVCIVPQKRGSLIASSTSHYTEKIYEILLSVDVDAIIDDRDDMTIGRRVIDAKRMGYPYHVIIGKSSIESPPLFELHDIYNSKTFYLELSGLKDFFQNNNSDQLERDAASTATMR